MIKFLGINEIQMDYTISIASATGQGLQSMGPPWRKYSAGCSTMYSPTRIILLIAGSANLSAARKEWHVFCYIIGKYPVQKNMEAAMREFTVNGKKVELDEEGFLVNQDDWNRDVASEIARMEGIATLDDEQLEIIEFMRNYYYKFNAFPILNYVCKHIEQPKQCVNDEFINPMKAWKIAGLPKMSGVHFVTVDGKNYLMEDFPG